MCCFQTEGKVSGGVGQAKRRTISLVRLARLAGRAGDSTAIIVFVLLLHTYLPTAYREGVALLHTEATRRNYFRVRQNPSHDFLGVSVNAACREHAACRVLADEEQALAASDWATWNVVAAGDFQVLAKGKSERHTDSDY